MLVSFPKLPKTAFRKPRKSMFSITPLSFDASSLRNLREYMHKRCIARKYSQCATSLPLTVESIFIQIFVVGSEGRMCFET